MITEQIENLRNLSERLLHADLFYVKTMLKQAADTIEQLASKAREDNVYQRAFEDIRADIERYEADCILAADSKECKECDKIVFGSIYHIIDKHAPGKAVDERVDERIDERVDEAVDERDKAGKEQK